MTQLLAAVGYLVGLVLLGAAALIGGVLMILTVVRALGGN